MRTLAVIGTLLASAGAADAALTVAYNVRSPALRVDARGNAEVSWRDQSGARRTLLVPAKGKVLPGGRLAGRDVSKPIGYALAFKVAVRRTPDGRLWALQRWRVRPTGPVELRLSRWRGAATSVTATVTTDIAATIAGTVRAGGRPIYGYSRTPEGKRIRDIVYVDTQTTSGQWRRLLGVFPRAPDGSFRARLFGRGIGALRAIALGPNRGTMFYPDAQSSVREVTPPPPPIR